MHKIAIVLQILTFICRIFRPYCLNKKKSFIIVVIVFVVNVGVTEILSLSDTKCSLINALLYSVH